MTLQPAPLVALSCGSDHLVNLLLLLSLGEHGRVSLIAVLGLLLHLHHRGSKMKLDILLLRDI